LLFASANAGCCSAAKESNVDKRNKAAKDAKGFMALTLNIR